MTVPSTALAVADFKTITDSLGKAYNDGLLALPSTTEAGYILTSANNVVAAVKAISANDPAIVALLPTAVTMDGVAAAPYKSVADLYANFLNALRSNIGSNWADYLDSGSPYVMISPQFAALVLAAQTYAFSKKYILPPQTDVATMAVTGSGTGTFGASGAIAPGSYGPAQMEVVVTGGTIGAASIVCTLTMLLWDGVTTEVKTATITNGSTAGTAFAIGTSSNRYIDCTAITFTGGTNADAFKVRSKVERVPAL